MIGHELVPVGVQRDFRPPDLSNSQQRILLVQHEDKYHLHTYPFDGIIKYLIRSLDDFTVDSTTYIK